MSGGDRKKRACDRGQGWEEAGAEFYQESYPAAIEADLQQALQRDPSHIATLLPSKKSRVATAKRIRNDTKTTLRRRTSTRSRGTTTSRRMSTNIHDAAVSMLPDLFENLSNEERTWEEIMQIKAMPVCMAQKIQLKNQLQSATKLRLQGFEQLKWQRRKAWQQFRIRMKEAYSKMELWNDSLKTIGGNFGMGIVAYFLFIKWLLYLNLLLFGIIFLFIVLPATLLDMPEDETCVNSNNSHSISCCSELYWNITQESGNIAGMLEYTLLFYGAYSHMTYTSAIVKSAAKSFKQRVVENEGQFYQYCNLVFGGWDYCIHNEKSAAIKHKALYNEMKAFLEAERLEEERQNRTREETTKLFLMRLFINLIVLAVLCGCEVKDNECTNNTSKRPLCWETFVGQQFFKLYITDVFFQFFMTFFINFPRSLIAKHTENKVLRFFGEQEFDLPKHVLDVVYLQTICWLGLFYAPLLPLIAIFSTFVLFYIKKFACLVNSTPSSKIYRAIGYSIAEIEPSKSCGPFRGFKSVWSLLIVVFAEFPDWLQSILYFLGTAGFGVPAFVILTLLLYYYYAVSIANKHMVTVLKNQLVLEGHDKQFLLNRLSAFIKQQQDQNKYHQEQANELGTFS
ncbi:Transmembrane channel-like protein 7 [Melipona quadrifasciata]|uniref:Transmembrane channel-like protein 7 n=1 Tax=Melipona quadrifasciata TaxID=166423 RepID=A0A0M8ZYW4_9HYME|nr:Transmembrane channel-like protein 7 [Melipona quadrifasciata]